MKLDSTTQKLFSPFFRECANPKRQPIKNQSEFSKFIERNNGVKDCYCDLYTYPFDGTIDKLYYDFDGIFKGFAEALPFAKRFFKFLTKEKGLSVIPVASGKKGFNLYVILKPKKHENAKSLLHDVQYSLITQEFGSVVTVTIIDGHGKEHPTMRTIGEGEEEGELIFCDPSVIGDVRRFARIPNTLRPPENLNYCTYLPSDEFLDMTAEDVAKHMKRTHVYDCDFRCEYPTLNDFEIVKGFEFKEFIPIENQIPIIPTKGNEFLKRILRPCLYRHMVGKEPKHHVRVASTVDLLKSGFDGETVFNIYAKLGWGDWNPETTRYQIEHTKYLKPYSCRKLRKKGIPSICCVG